MLLLSSNYVSFPPILLSITPSHYLYKPLFSPWSPLPYFFSLFFLSWGCCLRLACSDGDNLEVATVINNLFHSSNFFLAVMALFASCCSGLFTMVVAMTPFTMMVAWGGHGLFGWALGMVFWVFYLIWTKKGEHCQLLTVFFLVFGLLNIGVILSDNLAVVF